MDTGEKRPKLEVDLSLPVASLIRRSGLAEGLDATALFRFAGLDLQIWIRDRPPPSSAEIKNRRGYAATLTRLHSVYRDDSAFNFTFTFTRGVFRPRQTRQLPRAVDLKGRLLSCQSY